MFSKNELKMMRDTQTAHMMDECIIYQVTEKVKNTRGEYVKEFDAGTRSICGIQMKPLAKDIGDNFIEADIDAILRLPLGTKVKPDDEIEIIKRFGEDVNVRRYEVEQHKNDGPSGCRVTLKERIIA